MVFTLVFIAVYVM